MATAKKQTRGATPVSVKAKAPNSHSLEIERRRQEKADQRERRRAAFLARQDAAQKLVHAEIAGRIAAPLKASEVRHKSTPGLEKETPTIGRPATVYTPELADAIFDMIVCGLSMEKISQREGMPGLHVMLRWLGEKNHPFGSDYSRAKDLMVPYYEERAVDIATTPQVGEIVTERDSEELGLTTEKRRADAVERSKLSFAAYQWALAHLRPRKHGRNPEDTNKGPNEQLKALFDSLQAGPVKTKK